MSFQFSLKLIFSFFPIVIYKGRKSFSKALIQLIIVEVVVKLFFQNMKSFIILFLTSSSLVLAQSDGSEPRFSIGLGVLAPSYSQKLDGNGRLDVNQDKNGFSYSLNNVVHPSSSGSGLQNDHKVSQKVLISKLSLIQDLKNKIFKKIF